MLRNFQVIQTIRSSTVVLTKGGAPRSQRRGRSTAAIHSGSSVPQASICNGAPQLEAFITKTQTRRTARLLPIIHLA